METGIDASALEKVINTVLTCEAFHSFHHQQHPAELLSKVSPECATIDYITEPISYNEFFVKYLLGNIPCLLGEWATKEWNSRKAWTKESGAGVVPDFEKLMSTCRSNLVPVADCRGREFNSQPKKDWKFEDYVEYFRSCSKANDSSTQSCFYLKDWHYFRDFPDEDVYKVPPYFKSDWLLRLWKSGLPPFQDDYRFVYIGPKTSWTPFHADVFRSNSWSANVCGRKKWLLFPPGAEESLRDLNGKLPFDVTTAPIEVTQERGEVMFVPSCWHHQVHNLEDTISINHNWLNGCTVSRVWAFLRSELRDVELEIRDCRELMDDQEWTAQCQLILNANSGINYRSFYDIIRNIFVLHASAVEESFPQCTAGRHGNDRNVSHTIENLPLMTQELAHLLSKLRSFSPHSALPLEELGEVCLIAPVLLDMTATCHRAGMTALMSDCASLLDAVGALIREVVVGL